MQDDWASKETDAPTRPDRRLHVYVLRACVTACLLRVRLPRALLGLRPCRARARDRWRRSRPPAAPSVCACPRDLPPHTYLHAYMIYRGRDAEFEKVGEEGRVHIDTDMCAGARACTHTPCLRQLGGVYVCMFGERASGHPPPLGRA